MDLFRSMNFYDEGVIYEMNCVECVTNQPSEIVSDCLKLFAFLKTMTKIEFLMKSHLSLVLWQTLFP